MLATLVHHLGHLTSALNGLTYCSMSFLIKEIWKRLKALIFPWCAIELQPILLVDKLASSNSSLCLFLSNLLILLQAFTAFNSQSDGTTSKSGRLELIQRKDKRKKKTRWKRFLLKLYLTVRLLRVLTSFKRSSEKSLWTRRPSTSEKFKCSHTYTHVYFIPDLY